MKKILGLKVVLNLALIVMLVGGLVYSLGFGICLYLARQEVSRESSEKVNLALSNIQTYVDGQLQRVEDSAYDLVSSRFAKTRRNKEGEGFVSIDPTTLVMPTEDEIFELFETFLDTNPHVCGVAIGFEDFLYGAYQGEYGFACYVTNVKGKKERLKLGNIHDFHQKEWYKKASETNKPYWSSPFQETSAGEVVTCFSLPLHGFGDRLIGVLAVDINTDSFRKECVRISPFPNAEVAIVDREFRFVAHPDTAYLLHTIQETGLYDDYKADDSMRIKMMNFQPGQYIVNGGTAREALFSFAPIVRSGWTISIECPRESLFGGVDRMKRDTTWIAFASILIMIICFVFFFRRLQMVTVSKANIEGELNVASRIQKGMLPKLYPAFPERSDLDVYGLLEPAKSVGGDLYDYFVRNDKLFFCIGDVSGKGVPASLFMAVIRALFRNVSLHEDDPGEIISALNIALSQGNDHNMFCTLFLGVLDLNTGNLEYCNAGHNAPIVRRVKADGNVDVHYATPMVNLAVGVIEEFPYMKESTVLNPGDAIFLYTDGVTEAENEAHQLFGEEATLNALAQARKQNVRSAKDFIDAVFGTVKKHAGSAEQSDDITMVVVEYKGKK